MNSLELAEARRWKEHQEKLKDPAFRQAYEYSQRKADEEKRRREVLDWYANGRHISSELVTNPREKTDEEIRIDELKKFM